MTAHVIDVEDLTRTYGTGDAAFTAVDGIGFGVRRGEVFGLLGTNGAGKTSTLEVIEGLVAPTSGRVRVLGRDPRTDRATLRPELGIMLQSGGLPQELTVEETLIMWRGTCTHPTTVADVLARVDLGERAGVRVAALSGGEQRRLDLACALIGQPSVLFLDEPTTGLDPESRRNTWRLLADLKARGVTMVLTTHYLDEAEALCDRLVLMHRGRIRRAGTLAEVVAGQPSTISFEPDVPVPDEFGARRDGDRTVIGTHDLQRDLYRLLAWADAHDVRLTGLQARAASLESVFLDIAEDRELEEVA